MISLLVLGSSELSRACMVASLTEAPDLRVQACVDPVDHQGPAPDIVLIQDVDDSADVHADRHLDRPMMGIQLAEQLGILAERWPGMKIMVLTNEHGPGLELCHDGGVRACLPTLADLDQILAAIRLIQAELIVYPAALLNQSKMIVARTWRSAKKSLGARRLNGTGVTIRGDGRTRRN